MTVGASPEVRAAGELVGGCSWEVCRVEVGSEERMARQLFCSANGWS